MRSWSPCRVGWRWWSATRPAYRWKSQETQDGGNFGTLILDNAPAEAIDGDATEALEHSIMASSAYLFGLMDRAFEITLDYMKTREQFGRKIGAFQALQHRAVDMQIQVSLTRATIGTAPTHWTTRPRSDSARRRCRVPRCVPRMPQWW